MTKPMNGCVPRSRLRPGKRVQFAPVQLELTQGPTRRVKDESGSRILKHDRRTTADRFLPSSNRTENG